MVSTAWQIIQSSIGALVLIFVLIRLSRASFVALNCSLNSRTALSASPLAFGSYRGGCFSRTSASDNFLVCLATSTSAGSPSVLSSSLLYPVLVMNFFKPFALCSSPVPFTSAMSACMALVHLSRATRHVLLSSLSLSSSPISQ